MENGTFEHIIKISQNENPLGPSPKAVEAVLKQTLATHLYPEHHSHSLKNKIAERLGLEPENVFVSAGLVESLDIMIRNFVGAGNNMVIGEVSFVAYRLLGKVFNVETRFAKLKDYQTDVGEILHCCDSRTKLVIVANPNNPTGATLAEAELVRLLEQVPPQATVVVDEAYREYVTQADYPDTLALLNHFPNLAIMRTFSKIYGLAALRVGYTIAQPQVVERLDHFQAPFTVNSLASAAAMHAIDDTEFVAKSARMNAEERRQLHDGLVRLGYRTVPSQGNFQFVYFDSVAKRDLFYEALCQHNVLARNTDLFGDEKATRLSVGKPEDNLKVIAALELIASR